MATSTQFWPVEEVLIQVWDADRRTPVCQQPDPDAELGRGLFLVEALGEDWGTYRPAGYPGRVVWSGAQGNEETLSFPQYR